MCFGENIVRILDPQPYFEVYQTGRNVRDKKVYLAEYKRYVEQSIIYDRSYHIVLGIMRDITAEESSRAGKEALERHTIEVTNQVIEKADAHRARDCEPARGDDRGDQSCAHPPEGVAGR